jgi:hypothetical protein
MKTSQLVQMSFYIFTSSFEYIHINKELSEVKGQKTSEIYMYVY